jgi:hypothetical protein
MELLLRDGRKVLAEYLLEMEPLDLFVTLKPVDGDFRVIQPVVGRLWFSQSTREGAIQEAKGYFNRDKDAYARLVKEAAPVNLWNDEIRIRAQIEAYELREQRQNQAEL